jgi:hypothetical protein
MTKGPANRWAFCFWGDACRQVQAVHFLSGEYDSPSQLRIAITGASGRLAGWRASRPRGPVSDWCEAARRDHGTAKDPRNHDGAGAGLRLPGECVGPKSGGEHRSLRKAAP